VPVVCIQTAMAWLRNEERPDCQLRLDSWSTIERTWLSGCAGRILASQGRSTLPRGSSPLSSTRNRPHSAKAVSHAGQALDIRVTTMSVEVEVAHEVSDRDLAAINRLLPQLSKSAPPLDADALKRVVSRDGNSLVLARADGEIAGMLTLVTFPIPTGLRAWIEDVVVDESARGQGVGAALTQEAIRLAQAAGARTIDLTSRPSRQSANRLYERLGFHARDTRAYRLSTGS